MRRLAFSVALVAVATANAEEGFVRIFDGESLAGWKESSTAAEPAWTVRDGVIHADGDKARNYLTYEKHDLADFELKLQYRFPEKKGNSGINLRARVDPTGKRDFQSYHADLGHVGIGGQVLGAWDFHTPGRKEHACFRGDRLVIAEDDSPTVTKIAGAITAGEIHKGGWNSVHLIVRGNRFQFFINGKPASEFTEHLPAGKRLDRGMLQLQLHDPGMVVEFKDIWLKVLE